MKVDIIIPNYNGSHLIQKNISYVLGALQGESESKVIIVDDGSHPSERNKLREIIDREKSKNIKLIKLKKNQGFSTAVNFGAKHSNADLLVFLNTDVRPDKLFLKPIVKRFQDNPNLFAVGCMDKSIESKETVLRGRGTATFSKGLVMHRKGSVSSDKTFWVSGGSSVVRKNIFDKLGAFDQLYNPFYWEDIDLSYRAQKSGYDIRFEKKSVVTHIHSEGSIKTHFSDEKVRMIAYRNQLLFVWKNITDSSMLLSHIFYLPYHIAKTLLSKDIQFVKALFIAITMIPDIIAKRSEQSKLYKKTDKELISKN